MSEFDYGEDVTKLSKDGLAALSELAKKIRAQEAAVEKAEEAWKEAKSLLRLLSQVTLPQLAAELGMASFTTDTGLKVEVKDKLSAKVTDKNREAIMAWLEATGNEAVINRTISIKLGKDELEQANKIALLLDEEGVQYKHTKGVHSASLGKVIRELDREGVKVDDKLLGIYRYQETKIK